MEDRFDFQWDKARYPSIGFIQKLRNLGIRLNLWEYSISIDPQSFVQPIG